MTGLLFKIGLIAGCVALLLSIRIFSYVPETWESSFPIRSGSIIQLLTGGTQVVGLPRGQGTLTLEGPAVLAFKDLRRNRFSGRHEGSLLLDRGEFLFRAHTDSPKQLLLHTPLMTVRVTGTELVLGHHPDQGSCLCVLEGKVLVKKQGGTDWEPVQERMQLTVTPDGKMQRQPIPNEWRVEPLPLPADSRTGFLSDKPEQESPPGELRRFLWYEKK